MNKNIYEINDDDGSEIKITSLNLEEVKSKIPSFSSEKLCEMIVCDRYFGFNQKISVFCMEELSKRRLDGNQFDFEDYIEKSFNDLPPLNFEVPDLRNMLSQMINKKIK